MELNLNMTAILVSVVVNFFIGFLWFTPLFGKIWGKEMGYDPNTKADPKVLAKGMIFMVIGNFFFAWVLAHNLAAWQFVPGVPEMGPLSNALSSAFFLWLGFYFPGHLGATVWEQKSWRLFAIEAGYSLVSLVTVSLILTHWTKS